MSNTGSFKPSNSGVAGIRPKRNDWRTKTHRAILDYGRRKGGMMGKADIGTADKLGIPGLGPKPRKFVERFLK
jgi:hypothetical protein